MSYKGIHDSLGQDYVIKKILNTETGIKWNNSHIDLLFVSFYINDALL